MASRKTIDLGAKLVRLEQALAAIRPGNRVYLGISIDRTGPLSCLRSRWPHRRK